MTALVQLFPCAVRLAPRALHHTSCLPCWEKQAQDVSPGVAYFGQGLAPGATKHNVDTMDQKLWILFLMLEGRKSLHATAAEQSL